jgi:hypothetical protein
LRLMFVSWIQSGPGKIKAACLGMDASCPSARDGSGSRRVVHGTKNQPP